jgi:hypothetical protein
MPLTSIILILQFAGVQLSLENMHVTYGPDANHVGETDFRTPLLAGTGLTAQLAHDLDDLADARRTDRMAHGNQSA